MALFVELMSTIIILVTKPFSLFKQACLFGLRAFLTVIQTWVELVKATIQYHVNMFWSFLIWALAFVSLPLRILTAMQRERKLEHHLSETQIELENLVWDKKELEERLQIAIKESKMMDMMLAELEDEQDKTIVKLEEIENELKNLKDENRRLKEVQGKEIEDTGKNQKIDESDKYGIACGIPSWKSGYTGSGVILQDLVMHRDPWDDKNEYKNELASILKTGLKPTGLIHPITAEGTTCQNLRMKEVLIQRRKIALWRTLFSAVLSLLVGIIIWEAKDPCMPLVVALFTVVGMSLMSVVQFFSTIDNRPASDAVALLSFNWFILGTLTYPTLPRVAHVLAPLAFSVVDRTVSWIFPTSM